MHTYRNDTAPGQSLQPIAIGLAGAERADFVAIDWSDGVFQSEIGIKTTQARRTKRPLSKRMPTANGIR